MAILSKTVLTSAFAAAMLAGSSFAFAADNNNGNNSNNDTSVGGGADKTGSITTNQGDSPSMDEKEKCINGAEASPDCAGKTQQ
jgi:hypothetical protein